MLQRNDYYEYGGGNENLSVELTWYKRDGIFEGGLSFSRFGPGLLPAFFRAGREHITGKWFEVATYTKPAYRIDLNKDKGNFPGRTNITIDIQASFSEGTPVSAMQLSYSDDQYRDQ